MLVALHKPHGYLSRFTPDGSANRSLRELGLPPRVAPIGRLDADSEGLLLLGDEPRVVDELLHPRRAHPRTYWAQLERVPDEGALARLEGGVLLDGARTRPCRARRLDDEPALPPREPPIRFRKSVPTCWIELTLTEGKNRQVRRMTAAVGFPTLRLVRAAIGDLALGELSRGAWRVLDDADRARLFSRAPATTTSIPRARAGSTSAPGARPSSSSM